MRIFFIILMLIISSIDIYAQDSLPPKSFDYGSAIFRGSISSESNDYVSDVIEMRICMPLSGEIKQYTIKITDNTFYQEIELPCISTAVIRSSFYEGVIVLIPDEETILNFTKTTKGEQHIDMKCPLSFSVTDMVNLSSVIMDAITNFSLEESDYKVSPEQFAKRVITLIDESIKKIEKDDRLSDMAKQLAEINVKMFYINNVLLDYSNYMNLMPNIKPSDIIEPDVEYYAFLKDLNICDSIYLWAETYPMFIESILKKSIFEIPPIGQKTVTEWQGEVGKKISNSVGVNDGLLYDMLAVKMYSNQLNDMQPLTKQQISNIDSYFPYSINQWLNAENDKVKKLQTCKKDIRLILNDESFNEILDQFKGKIVFIDFWATWCEPCLRFIKETKGIKKSFSQDEVVFLYITDNSSPQKKWLEEVNKIDGIHIYIQNDIFSYLQEKFSMRSIPSYLLYDKSGNLVYKKSGIISGDELIDQIRNIH